MYYCHTDFTVGCTTTDALWKSYIVLKRCCYVRCKLLNKSYVVAVKEGNVHRLELYNLCSQHFSL